MSTVSSNVYSYFPQPHILDLRSLAVFRIGFGLYLCYDVVSRLTPFGVGVDWYTTSPGFLLADDSPHGNPVHQVWFARTSEKIQYLLFAAVFFLSFALAMGKLSRMTSRALLWMSVVSMQHRCMHVHDGSDNFTRQMLLWFTLLPDAIHQQMSLKPHVGKVTQVTSIACLGLMLQVVLMYLGTISKRTIDSPANPSYEWLWPELSAVHYILRDSFAIRDNILVEWVRRQPLNLTKCMTAHAMLVESSAIVWFLCPSDSTLRFVGFIVLSTFHFGLLLVTRLPNWQCVGMIASVLWIPSHQWDSWGFINTGGDHQNDEENENKSKTDNNVTSGKQSSTTRVGYRIVTHFLLGYMLYNFSGERGWISKHDGGDVGEFLRISQYWVMYSAAPKTSVETNLVGLARNGNYMDVMNGFHSGNWTMWHPQNLGKIDFQTFVTPRWERALDQFGRAKDKKRARIFVERLCYHIPTNLDVVQINLVWKYYSTELPGMEGRRTPMNAVTTEVKCKQEESSDELVSGSEEVDL